MPVLFLSVVLDLVGFGIILPLLPFYALHFGASALLVTLLGATFSLAQMIASPICGRLSDAYGRRPVFLACLALSVIAYVGLAMADSLLLLFVARAANGAAAGKIGVAQAIVADITPPEKRARGMGRLGAAFGLGMVLGPALGGALASGGNYQLPALIAAAFSLLALVVAAWTVPESLPPEQRRQGQAQGGGPDRGVLLRQPHIPALVALFFMLNFCFTHVEAVFPLWGEREFGWGPAEIGIVFTFIGLGVALVQAGLVGALAARFGERRVLLAGMVALAAGMLVTPFIETVALFAFGTLLTVYGFASSSPSLMALTSRAAAVGVQGATLGLANSAGALGRVLGPGIAGWQFDAFGHDAPYVTGGVLLLGAALFAALATPRR